MAAVMFACVLGLAASRRADASATGDESNGDRRAPSAAITPMPTQPPTTPLPSETSEELVYEAVFSRILLRGIKVAEFKFTSGRAPATHTNIATTGAINPSDATTKNDANAAASDGTTDAANAPATNAAKSAGQGERTADAAAPLLLTADIVSRGWFRKLFGINFHYHVESTVEPRSFQLLRTSVLDEQGKRVRTREAIFDRAARRITWTERDPNDATRPPRVETSPVGGASVYDIITAIYYLRTQPLAPGKTFELSVSDSGEVYRVPVKVYAEPKRVKSALGRFAVVRVEVELFGKDRLVEDEGRMTLWMTDDARHLPLRAHISNRLGTLDISLKSATQGGARPRTPRNTY